MWFYFCCVFSARFTFFSYYSRRSIYLFLKLALFCSVHADSFLSCFSLWLLLHRSLHFSIHSSQWRSYSIMLHAVLWPAFLPVLDLKSVFKPITSSWPISLCFLGWGNFPFGRMSLLKVCLDKILKVLFAYLHTHYYSCTV